MSALDHPKCYNVVKELKTASTVLCLYWKFKSLTFHILDFHFEEFFLKTFENQPPFGVLDDQFFDDVLNRENVKIKYIFRAIETTETFCSLYLKFRFKFNKMQQSVTFQAINGASDKINDTKIQFIPAKIELSSSGKAPVDTHFDNYTEELDGGKVYETKN